MGHHHPHPLGAGDAREGQNQAHPQGHGPFGPQIGQGGERPPADSARWAFGRGRGPPWGHEGMRSCSARIVNPKSSSGLRGGGERRHFPARVGAGDGKRAGSPRGPPSSPPPPRILTEVGDRALSVAIALNLGLTGVEAAVGAWAGSLALMADAVHNLGDAAALGVAFGARHIAQRGRRSLHLRLPAGRAHRCPRQPDWPPAHR